MIERLLAAQAALDRGELEVAARLYRQVADADPRNAIAVVGLARIASLEGRPGDAEALVSHALEIDPAEAAARRMLVEIVNATSGAAAAPGAGTERSREATAPAEPAWPQPTTEPWAPPGTRRGPSVWQRLLRLLGLRPRT